MIIGNSWRNTDDRDVKKFLNFFTEIEPKKVENIYQEEKNINHLKILLANEATRILHGKDATKKAEQTAKDTFESGGIGSDLPEIKIESKKIEERNYYFRFNIRKQNFIF